MRQKNVLGFYNDDASCLGGQMKQTTMKRITALAFFILAGTLLGTLRADAPVQNSAAQTSPELSVPKAKLLDPSFKWHQSHGIAEKCLLVGRLDLKDTTAWHLLYAIDLPGERFVGSPEHGDSTGWDFKDILKEAGYNHQVTIPDKHLVLSGQEEQTIISRVGYIKREGKNLRLILITYGANAFTGSAMPVTKSVFVSDVTPLERILKDPQR